MRKQRVCQIDPGHNGAGARVGNLHLLIADNVLQDFMWTSYGNCLIEEKTRLLFLAEGFTGLQTAPVHLRYEPPSERPLPILHELKLTGWGGVARPESGVRIIRNCATCGLLEYSPFTNGELILDQNQWEGTDFFMVWPMPLYVFITDRVATFIRAKGLSGAEILELRKMRLPRGFGPGRLSHWLPEDRARQLGEPLGIY
jgi:hypothetical protein